MRDFATKTEEGLEIRVKVISRSSKSEIVGEFNGMLKVRLNAPPVEGAANKELIKLLSKEFSVAKTEISIIGGRNSRLKILLVETRDLPSLLRKVARIGMI